MKQQQSSTGYVNDSVTLTPNESPHETETTIGGVVNSEGYSYVDEVPSLRSSHQSSHHHNHSNHNNKSSSSSNHRGSSGGDHRRDHHHHHHHNQQHRPRRTQRRVTHTEKRYHSGLVYGILVYCISLNYSLTTIK